jgi:hypothetical protein
MNSQYEEECMIKNVGQTYGLNSLNTDVNDELTTSGTFNVVRDESSESTPCSESTRCRSEEEARALAWHIANELAFDLPTEFGDFERFVMSLVLESWYPDDLADDASSPFYKFNLEMMRMEVLRTIESFFNRRFGDVFSRRWVNWFVSNSILSSSGSKNRLHMDYVCPGPGKRLKKRTRS